MKAERLFMQILYRIYNDGTKQWWIKWHRPGHWPEWDMVSGRTEEEARARKEMIEKKGHINAER